MYCFDYCCGSCFLLIVLWFLSLYSSGSCYGWVMRYGSSYGDGHVAVMVGDIVIVGVGCVFVC